MGLSRPGLSRLTCKQPGRRRHRWRPPTNLGEKVALLALVTHAAHDDLAVTNTGTLRVGPQPRGDAAQVIEERRAALRIVDAWLFVPDLFVRDAVHDDALSAQSVLETALSN